VADQGLSGILLAGGASSRFGSPKALAELGGETLAERAWRLLGEVCTERMVVGGDGLADPGTGPVAAIAVGLRAARHEIALVIPVDMPLLTPSALRLLAEACGDAATAQHGPLPCAVARRALPAFETGERRLRTVLDGLATARIELEERLLVNVNEPGDLRKIAAAEDDRTRGEA
jgi:molybdopterin-guanine dinucleotide biosynthesis protein A